MATNIKLPPDFNICSNQDAIDSATKPRDVTYLYRALQKFDGRFSKISQDVTDPVRPLSLTLSPTRFAMMLPRQKLTATNLSPRFLWK